MSFEIRVKNNTYKIRNGDRERIMATREGEEMENMLLRHAITPLK